MHIRVLSGGELAHGIEHAGGLLRGRRVVEVDERAAVHFAREDRKIAPQRGHVIVVLHPRFDAHVSVCPIALSTASSRCHTASCTAGSTKSTIASSRNARINRAFASSSGMPRERK